MPPRRNSRIRWQVYLVGGLALVILVSLAHGGFHAQPVSPRAAAAARPLTRILGVLRQPQKAVDFPPAVNAFLVNETRTPTFRGTLGTPIQPLIRFTIVSPWGQHVYLMPSLPPTARQIARLPRRLRQRSPASTASFVFYPYVTLGVTEGLTATEVMRGQAWAGVGGPGGRDRILFAFPDGVAKVRLWPAGAGAAPITLTVARNVAAFTAIGFRGPGREVWYGPSGQVIRRIPTPGS